MPQEETRRPMEEKTKLPVNADKENPKIMRLDTLIGENNFRVTETDFGEEISLADKKNGLMRTEDGNYVFDKKALDEHEVAAIDIFLSAYESRTLDQSRKFGWYFENEMPEFLDKLAQHLRERRQLLLEGQIGDESKLENLGFSNDALIKSAAELMRTSAQREMIRRVVKSQIDYFPVTSIKTATGKEIPFSGTELFGSESAISPGNLDWILVNGPDGEQELVISSQYGIDSVGIAGDSIEAIINAGKFSFSLENKFNQKRTKDDPIVLTLDRGGADVRPIFTRIRFVKEAISLDQKLDQYIKEQDQKKYSPSAPSVSSGQSSSNWNSPSYTYVRSG